MSLMKKRQSDFDEKIKKGLIWRFGQVEQSVGSVNITYVFCDDLG